MAIIDEKISDLDAVVTPAATDDFAVVQGGVTLKESRAQVHALESGEHLILPQVAEPSTPTLAFGDGDTGFFENSDDVLFVGVIGLGRFLWTGNEYRASDQAGPVVINEAATSINPTFVPNRSDVDTGLGWTAADQMSLIAGGVQIANLTEAAGTVQMILPLQNDATAPSIAFGDGDTGFFEPADDEINISIEGVSRFHFVASVFSGLSVSAPGIRNTVPTATNVGIFANANDQNTGIGWSDFDQLSFIAGAVQVANLTEAAGTVQFIVPQQNVSASPSIAFGDGDTGFFESLDDTLNIAFAGVKRWNWTESLFESNTDLGAHLNRQGASATVAAFAFKGDTNTGLGRGAIDELSLIAGGVQVANLTEAAGIVQFIVPLQNDAASPSIAFGDGDSGFYESIDDTIHISIAGASKWDIDASAIEGSGVGNPALRNVNATGLVPSILPQKEDINTGIGSVALDQLSLIAGSKEMLRLVETGVATTDQLIIGPAGVIGTAATPALAFGDGDTGFYENSDDVLFVTLGTFGRFLWTGNEYRAANAAGPVVINEAATATVPTFAPNRADVDTGLGWGGTNELSLIAGALDCIQVSNVSSARRIGFYVTAPVALQTGVAVTDVGIHAALVNLGLITA